MTTFGVCEVTELNPLDAHVLGNSRRKSLKKFGAKSPTIRSRISSSVT